MFKTKKIIFVLGVFVFHMAASAVYAQQDQSFADVPLDSKYFIAIEHFKQQDVIQGYNDGTFRPGQEATRAEALKIILLSSGIQIHSTQIEEPFFPDVLSSEWYYPHINTAKEMGIVMGYEDGMYKPNQTQNIAETLKIIFLANGISADPVPENTSLYPDVSYDAWFAPFALYAKEKNIIEPQDDGKMHPEKGVTRGELVEIMYRLEMVLANNNQPFDISTNWKYNNYPQYSFKAKLPFDWKVVNNEDQVVFWHPDATNHQSTYEVPFPFSASITFHLDMNAGGLSPTGYTEKMEQIYKAEYGSYQKNTLMLGGVQTLNLNAGPDNDDFFLFFPENRVLNVFTSYGWSDLTPHLKLEIDGVLRSIQNIALTETESGDLVSDARALILVEGQGQAVLDKFSDLIIIETDTIGAGNGPVDYYYSAGFDITIKFERVSVTVLDIQTGRTSAF
ncbi:S-layer homology domain-containing protein [Candidatus Peregrinibacteria bacterium]|nr:S-layer homology domain-containing protein [Candidatus Peregrinibacteria bacterium]